MNHLLSMIVRPISSSSTDAKWCQFVCWLASIVIAVLGVRKLTRLQLTEAELFFGVLLLMTVVLLCVLIGLVLPFAIRRDKGSF